jgi:4-hydroxythreonine-4-phosphate dehydrogenase
MKPIIAISMGDYNGIGPEVTLKALAKADLRESVPLWIGSETVLKYYSRLSGLSLPFTRINRIESLKPGNIYLYDPFEESEIDIQPGLTSTKAGGSAMKAVDIGITCCLQMKSHALVTAPISKEAISKAGYTVPGHTEFLAEKTSTQNVVMMLVSNVLRVALATIHIPLKDVAPALNTGLISENLQILHKSLQYDFGISSPKIAVLGLNPHAGDGGVIGDEEIRIIRPAIELAKHSGFSADGPFPADGYFGNHLYKAFDATLAVYHDQGLIPFKTLSFGQGVNFTAGLPIVRTSPDHGTAFGIAGTNKGDERSFLEAYQLAVKLASNRQTQTVS